MALGGPMGGVVLTYVPWHPAVASGQVPEPQRLRTRRLKSLALWLRAAPVGPADAEPVLAAAAEGRRPVPLERALGGAALAVRFASGRRVRRRPFPGRDDSPAPDVVSDDIATASK